MKTNKKESLRAHDVLLGPNNNLKREKKKLLVPPRIEPLKRSAAGRRQSARRQNLSKITTHFFRLDLIAATRKVFLPFGPTWSGGPAAAAAAAHCHDWVSPKRFQRIAYGVLFGRPREVRLWFTFSRANDVSTGAFRGSLFCPPSWTTHRLGHGPKNPRTDDPWWPLEGCLSANNFIK